MWDTKRQLIWLALGITFGTLILYQDAYDEETGRFGVRNFLVLETLLLLIIGVMFYIYSRKNK